MSDVVIRVEGVSKLYRLGEVGTGSLAHDVNRWWHKVRGKEDPYLKIGEVLGIIGQNGAARKACGRQDYRTAGRRTGGMTPVNQAAGQPLGRLPQAARRVRRRGKARINSTLLKILSRVTTQTEGRIKECLGKMKDVASHGRTILWN